MKNKKVVYIISAIVTILFLISFTIVSYNIFKLAIIPTKYLITGYVVIIGITLIQLINLYRKSKLYIKIISLISLVLLSIVFIIGTTYLENTYHFLSGTQVEYDTLKYSVVVLKNSNYNKLKDLNNKNISYLDDKYKEDVKKNIKNIKYNETYFKDLSASYDLLNNNSVDAIVLEEGYLTLAKEEIKDFEENTKVIHTITIKVKAYREENKIDITSEPFIIYISGIDQYGNVASVRGRSDVNQIMVINPKTHHILIANTPRDYYVQLAGTTGLRDKLTHAGIYGVEKSINTLEQIYDIDINNYVRINFDSLIKVVDLIGGIDIYSDSSFTCWTNKSVHVEQGMNHFNGTQALAYSRERKSYVDGDFHRGRNQQQVIEAIINKLTTSDEIIRKYNSILNSLDGSFQTDISTSTITSFIRYQLDKMPSWNVETMQAYGYSSWGHTYSMPSYLLWVMEPDWNSVEKIKVRINEVLNEK